MTVTIHTGDCRAVMRLMPAKSVHACITSPPYFGLRDYNVAGQIGLEPQPDCLGWATGEPCGACFVCAQVEVFLEVRRVLRDDGTCWVNLGDSYASRAGGYSDTGSRGSSSNPRISEGTMKAVLKGRHRAPPDGLKQKDLMGMPWRVALALQADGWYLRQDVIWSKPNPMPESVRDRCTKAHEYLFLFSKSPKYYFDAAAISEAAVYGNEAVYAGAGSLLASKSNAGANQSTRRFAKGVAGWAIGPGNHDVIAHAQGDRSNTHASTTKASQRNSFARTSKDSAGEHGQKPQHRPDREDVDYSVRRNKRSVWEVPTQPCSEAHFATYPTALIEPCVLASVPVGGVVLDPFGGAGTTGLVAEALGRDSVLIELNPDYAAIAHRRTQQCGLALATA